MRKSSIFIIFLTFSIQILALNFSLMPMKFNVDLNLATRKSYDLKIINESGRPLRTIVYLENVKNDLKSHIRLFPKKLSIKPAGKGVVRFTIRDLKSLKRGKYDTLIVVREINASKKSDKQININMIMEIALHIRGEKK